jgi:hypothetical protein
MPQVKASINLLYCIVFNYDTEVSLLHESLVIDICLLNISVHVLNSSHRTGNETVDE